MLYGSLLSSCEKCGQWTQACDLMQRLRAKQLEVDIIAMNAMISAYEKLLGLDFRLQAVASKSFRCGQWERALDLLKELDENLMQSTVITYNAAMSACDQTGHWEASLELLQEMRRRQLQVDLISYNASISACEAGNWQTAIALVAEMMENRIQGDAPWLWSPKACKRRMAEIAVFACLPQEVTLTAALEALGRRWQHALLLYHTSAAWQCLLGKS